MVLVVDQAAPRHVVVAVSPLAELTACLHALTEAEHHGATRAWRTEVREQLSPQLATKVRRYAPTWAAYRSRVLYPVTGGTDAADLETELEAVATMPLDEFTRFSGFACAGGYSAVELEDPLRDNAQRSALLAAARAGSTARLELAEALLADPERFRRDFLDFLAECRDTFFADTWTKVEARLQQSAASMRDRLAREDLASVLASLSQTADILTDPLRVVIDKFHHSVVNVGREGLRLVPSWYGWPHLTVKHEPQVTPLIQFAVSGRRRLPLEHVRHRLDALSDPRRLPLCRLIAREPLSTLALAERVGMTEPQVSRHLRRLREAGLVRAERDGRFVYYTLDVDEVARLGSDVLTTLFQ